MHIGIVGGIGPAATDYYYRGLIAAAAEKGFTLELTIVHAEAPTLIKNQAAGDVAAQAAVFLRLAERLQAVGADITVITSIAGHFCIEDLKRISPLPVIDMIEEVDRDLEQRGLERVGVLGTRMAMETGLYGRVRAAHLLAPAGDELDAVHEAYATMAAAGKVTPDQRKVFLAASRRLIDEQGAEAIMLGGTDLALVFDGTDYGFDIVDCARIHVEAIARRAAGQPL